MMNLIYDFFKVGGSFLSADPAWDIDLVIFNFPGPWNAELSSGLNPEAFLILHEADSAFCSADSWSLRSADGHRSSYRLVVRISSRTMACIALE
jgi:hypothetical protein